jgi:hypothetical protein
MSDVVTRKTITESLAAIKNGLGANVWLGTFIPPTERKEPYDGVIVVTNAALDELRKNGYNFSGYEGQEMSGKSTLTFYNPKTGKSIGVASTHTDRVQLGENGPTVTYGVNLSKPDLLEQLTKRDEDKNTYVTIGLRNRHRLIAPKNDNIVIGNEAFLAYSDPKLYSERNYGAKQNPELSIFREGGHVKFSYGDYTTSIPADKVKTLRIGDNGAHIDPKTITAKPLVIDLPKSIESGKIVSPAISKKADLGLSESIQLAETEPTEVTRPNLPNIGSARQV